MLCGDVRLVAERYAVTGVLLLCLLATPISVTAQRATTMPRIAAIFPGTPDCPITPPRAAFLQTLDELGFAAGTTLVVDWRCYSSIGEAPALIAEAIRVKSDVIVTADLEADE